MILDEVQVVSVGAVILGDVLPSWKDKLWSAAVMGGQTALRHLMFEISATYVLLKIVISSSSLSYPGPQGFPEYFDKHTYAVG